MDFAVGNLNTLTRKCGSFGDYEVIGYFVEDTVGQTGWLIDLSGIDSGTFTVIGRAIHRSSRDYAGDSNGRTVVHVDPQLANVGEFVQRAIFDAIAKWEAEDAEISRT